MEHADFDQLGRTSETLALPRRSGEDTHHLTVPTKSGAQPGQVGSDDTIAPKSRPVQEQG